MNCIGPWAPATLVSRMRPKSDSTKLTAASNCHDTPDRRSPSAYHARSFAAAAAGPGRNALSGRGGVSRASSRCASTSSVTSRASAAGSRRITRDASGGSSERRSSTFCIAYALATLTGAALARISRAASSLGGVCIRELQVGEHVLEVLASILRKRLEQSLQRLDRDARLLEIARLLVEPREGERGEERRGLDRELLRRRQLLLSLRFVHRRPPAPGRSPPSSRPPRAARSAARPHSARGSRATAQRRAPRRRAAPTRRDRSGAAAPGSPR